MAAGKTAISSELEHPSRTNARADSADLVRGLKPPQPSGSSISATRTDQTPSRGAVQHANPNRSQSVSPNVSQVQAAAKLKVAGATLMPVAPVRNRMGPAWGRDRSLAIDEAVSGVMQAAAQSEAGSSQAHAGSR